MTNKILYKIVMIVCLLLMTAAATACSLEGVSIVGDATVNIELSDTYPDVAVSCVNGTISKVSNTKYTVKLDSRNLAHILITATGYETEVIQLTTSQLAQGDITKTITLKERKIMLYLTPERYIGDLAKIEVESKTMVDGVKSVTVDSGRLLVELDDYNQVIEVSAEGYCANDVALTESDFFNYQAALSMPLVKESFSGVVLTLINDISQDFSQPITFRLHKYGSSDVDDSTIYLHNQSFSTVLDVNTNYLIKAKDNYPISKKMLIEKLNDKKPYLTIKASDLVSNETTLEIVLPEGYTYKDFEIITSRGYSELMLDDKGNFLSYRMNECVEGQSLLIVGKRDSDSELTIFYRHTITNADIKEGKITIEDKDEKDILTSELLLFRNDLPDEEVKLSINMIPPEDWGNVVKSVYPGVVIFDTYQLYKQFGYSNIFFDYADNMSVSIYSFINKPVYEHRVYDVEITCVDIEGREITVFNQMVEEGKEVFVPIDGDDADYAPIILNFYSQLFDYDEAADVYKYQLTAFKQRTLEVIIANESYYNYLAAYIDSGKSYDQLGWVQQDNKRFLVLNEAFIGKVLRINGRIENTHVEVAITLSKEQFTSGKINVVFSKPIKEF